MTPAQRQLPASVVPLLEQVRARMPQRDVPLDFWRIDSGPRILDGFMDLAALLSDSDLEEESVPRGYVLLAHLFAWEAGCQCDGWGAFGNIPARDFDRICLMFTEVGLEAEARALAQQMKAYRADPADAAALAQAAAECRHALSGDLDRLEYLTQYFCDHADELLYRHA
jgi:hypothetical protein